LRDIKLVDSKEKNLPASFLGKAIFSTLFACFRAVLVRFIALGAKSWITYAALHTNCGKGCEEAP
jgi:hypothetical protein